MKDRLLRIRISQEELADLKQSARERGQTMSELVRDRCIGLPKYGKPHVVTVGFPPREYSRAGTWED